MLLQNIVDDYSRRYPREAHGLSLLRAQLSNGETLNDRKNFRGHVTGSAIILSPDHSRVLMIHHKFLNIWLQPGGHMDPDEMDPSQTALREAVEETGVRIAQQIALDNAVAEPITISTHAVPANPGKGEPAHYHHDFRYLFQAADEVLKPQLQEVNFAEWVDLKDQRTLQLEQALTKLRSVGVI